MCLEISGSQQEAVLYPKGHLAMSVDVFGCDGCEAAAGIQEVEAGDAATHPAVCEQPSHKK